MCIFSKPKYNTPKVDPAPTPAAGENIAQPEGTTGKRKKPGLDFASTRTPVLTDEVNSNGGRTTLG